MGNQARSQLNSIAELEMSFDRRKQGNRYGSSRNWHPQNRAPDGLRQPFPLIAEGISLALNLARCPNPPNEPPNCPRGTVFTDAQAASPDGNFPTTNKCNPINLSRESYSETLLAVTNAQPVLKYASYKYICFKSLWPVAIITTPVDAS